MRKILWAAAGPATFLWRWPFALAAQNPAGSLISVVQDSTGARIPSAKIFIQSMQSNAVRPGTTVGIPFAAQAGVRATF